MAQRPLIGVSPDQVSTNGMLGDLAFQDSNGAYIETIRGAVSLDKLDKEITDTAVDIFVYDTRKDSDGGAWRKRTQHTSWYNETLNTATRGSRREFPAVAVIVAETTKVTIYDGDDPDLPMWMVFNIGGILHTNSNNLTSIHMLNGSLVWTSFRAGIINFISESAELLEAGFSYELRYGIVYRHDSGSWITSNTRTLLNSNCRDCSMVVLNNSPIDPSTDLPIPTIIIATEDGINILQTNGTVTLPKFQFHPGYNGNRDFVKVDSDEDGYIAFNASQVYPSYQDIIFSKVSAEKLTSFTTDYSLGPGAFSFTWDGELYDSVSVGSGSNITRWNYNNPSRSIDNPLLTKKYLVIGTDENLALIDKKILLKKVYPQVAELSICHITSSYNTGFLPSETRLSVLTDTDATNITGTELVNNGTFTDNILGWTDNSGSGSSISWSSGTIYLDGAAAYAKADQAITTVVGKTYVFSAEVSGQSGSETSQIWAGTAVNTFDLGYTDSGASYNGVMTITFTATTTTTWIRLYSGWNVYFDNVSVRLADASRSFEGHPRWTNTGMQVFGTITKQAVNTGCELVSYSGFTADNYLHQPYTSLLDYSTNDFYYMFWIKPNNSDNGDVIFSRDSIATGGATRIQCYFYGDTVRFDITGNGQSAYQGIAGSNHDIRSDYRWHHVIGLRRGSYFEIYIDGDLATRTALVSGTSDGSQTDGTATLNIGADPNAGSPLDKGELALFRSGMRAPSPDQIKNIYNEEKYLFHTNAKCTLYGSSSSISAFGYDSDKDILHIGTSSGRSDFIGLCRINNTTTAVTTSISASNGLVAEQ